MAWTKLKTTVVVGVGVLLAAGTTIVAVKEIKNLRPNSWQDAKYYDSRIVDGVPAQVAILPSRHKQGGGSGESNGKMMGLGTDFKQIMDTAYSHSWVTTIFAEPPPSGKFDFIANLRSGSREALKREAKIKFGLVGRNETINTNVLLLKVSRTGAPGLKRASGGFESGSSNGGAISGKGMSLDFLAAYLEGDFNIPIVDATGDTNRYDFHLKWGKNDWQSVPDNNEAIKKALLEQLGLELVPDVRPVDYLIIEKVK